MIERPLLLVALVAAGSSASRGVPEAGRTHIMQKIAFGCAAVVLGGTIAVGQSTPVTLASVADAMGVRNLNTIEYSGSGYSFAFQQAPGPGEPWPLFIVDTYKMSIDYSTPSMRFESTRAQGERPPRGGAGQPLAGNARTIQMVSRRAAWSEGAGGRVQPNPGAVRDRLRQLWLTPHGVVKAAMAANAPVANRVISFTVEGLPIKVRIGANQLVERIEYLIDSPVLGDVPVEVIYSDYRDFGGVKFPIAIIEKTDGYLTWDIKVADAKPNAPVAITSPADLPPAPAQAAGGRAQPAPKVDSRQIAPGVWHMIVSNYASILIEFRDFLLMFEGPVDDARSIAANEWARNTVPGKPLRYVVNTHAHFDHAGGLRAYAADGITIITHEMNRSYYEKVWDRPRTLGPDKLALKPRAPAWETMTEKKVVSDGSRTLELHMLKNNGHNPYIIIGYLSAEKIVLYGDMYNPPAGSDPRDAARTNEYAENLYDNIVNRLKLDVRLLAPIHGLPVPLDNLKKAIGLIPRSQ
jgi:glyoxylase-like metal-dependent hydrolase (beta-lactamase superfamily II)